MHMADALLTPAIGGAMWLTTAGLAAYSAKKVQTDLDEAKVPLMGVLGAFIFAAQMINFSIPATGSSGHIGGGLILAILLGPYAAFLTMASILTTQALFFADGGLLALGCNIFNLGFFPCFIAYPLIYQSIVKDAPSRGRLFAGVSLAAIVGLQLGAFGVVVETFLSGISELPFYTFLLLMQPIHLAIGVVEGLVTTAVILFVWRERPELLRHSADAATSQAISFKRVIVSLAIATILTGGVLSWFASSAPDGLEWSIARVTGQGELEAPAGIHTLLAELQKKTALLPDYQLKDTNATAEPEPKGKNTAAWPSVDSGTSVAGWVGSLLTLFLAGVIGKSLQLFAKRLS